MNAHAEGSNPHKTDSGLGKYNRSIEKLSKSVKTIAEERIERVDHYDMDVVCNNILHDFSDFFDVAEAINTETDPTESSDPLVYAVRYVARDLIDFRAEDAQCKPIEFFNYTEMELQVTVSVRDIEKYIATDIMDELERQGVFDG